MKMPPRVLWTCRDWIPGEPTEKTRKAVKTNECDDCTEDASTCKGPVKYGRNAK